MATLLNGATANTTGSAQTHSGPCTVIVKGELGEGRVAIQISDTTNAEDFVKPEYAVMRVSRFDKRTGSCTVDSQGTYSLRAILEQASADTSVSVVTIQ